jgi:hypothetical protein
MDLSRAEQFMIVCPRHLNIHLCHKSKREIVILKLDFEKEFDKMEYSVILLMLKHLGFGDIWIN